MPTAILIDGFYFIKRFRKLEPHNGYDANRAAKLARRERVDFVLDPMWLSIHPSRNEHIDGLRSTCPDPRKKAMCIPGLEVRKIDDDVMVSA